MFPILLHFLLSFYSLFCIFLHISPKIGLTYLPVCAACFVAFPSLKARPLIDNMFPIHISFGEKLPNWHSGITAVIASQTLSRKDFLFHYKKLLQELFRLTALLHCPGSSAGIPDLTKPLLPFLIWPLYLYKA